MLEAKRIDGQSFYLRPVTEGDREAFRALFATDPAAWDILTTSAVGEHFAAYWTTMLDTANRITLAIVEQGSDRIVGTSSFFLIDAANRTVEIGYTFFAPDARGTVANPQAKYLMLREAFDAGCLRVQFSVNAVNARSQAAVTKLGATREGVLRNHRIIWNGNHRDTVIFSIIDSEWPAVKSGLEQRLHASAG